MLDDLVRQLDRELEMEESVPLEAGHYRISLARGVEIDLFQLPQTYLFKSSIGPPPAKKEPFYMVLMQANLFGHGTRGGVIGLDPERNLLTLSMELSYNSAYKNFREKLEDFVSVLEYWRTEAGKSH